MPPSERDAALDVAFAQLLEDSAEDLYDGAPCGYLSALPDGTVVKVNQTFLDWTGHARDDLVGRRRFTDLLSPGGRIYCETHLLPLLSMQGDVREVALEVVRADGGRLPVLLNAVLKRTEAGAPLLVRVTVFDASDRRRYEEELLRARRSAEESSARVQALQERTATAEHRATFLSDMLRALAEEHGVRDRAQRLVDHVVPELADCAAVELVEAATDVGVRRTACTQPGEDDGPVALGPLDAPEMAEVASGLRRGVTSGEPQVVPLHGRGAGTCAVLPLRSRGRVLGALLLARTQPVPDSDLAFLVDLADRAGLALENARLFEQQRDVALTLQHALLAGEPPRDDRFSVEVRYRPGDQTLRVGGDWYDVFALDEGRVGLVIGDVVGRGLSAASAMGQLRSALRALAGVGLGPARVLEQLDAFVESVPGAQTATVCYAEVELDSGRGRYACAGHLPPLLACGAEPPQLLWEARSAPLGAEVDGAPRPEADLHVPAGSRLLLYTDGLVERRGESLDEGLGRLVAEVARQGDAPVPALVDEVLASLLADEQARDDVCVLCFAWQPAGP